MNIHFEFEVGEKVHDDLTHKEATIICIEFKDGCKQGEFAHALKTIGYWLDNDYLGGGRHPWEISKIRRLN
jgi:ribose 5-phosphate isomerase RpiB